MYHGGATLRSNVSDCPSADLQTLRAVAAPELPPAPRALAAPEYTPLEASPQRLRALALRRIPPLDACRDLGCSVYALIAACHRARIQYPGLPPAVTDRRAQQMQAALEASEAPAQAAPQPVSLPRDECSSDQVAQLATEGIARPAKGIRQDHAMGPAQRVALERIDRYHALRAEGLGDAQVCAALGLTAAQACRWAYRYAVPGLPTPCSRGVADLQRRIDALGDGERRGAVVLPVVCVDGRLVLGPVDVAGDLTDADALAVLAALAGRPADGVTIRGVGA